MNLPEYPHAYFGRLTLALDDIIWAEKNCAELIAVNPGAPFSTQRTVAVALTTALVVSYGRIFESSRTARPEEEVAVANAFGELKGKVIREYQRRSLNSTHIRMIDLRNKVFAHSDASKRNYSFTSTIGIPYGRNPMTPLHIAELGQVQSILQVVGSKVGAEQNRVRRKLFPESFKAGE